MNKIIKHIAIQLLIIIIPLGGLYLFAQHIFAENRKREYKLLTINCVFILIFTLPILNIHCLMGGELFFCDDFLNFIDELF